MRRTALIEDEPERFEVAGRGSPRDDLVDATDHAVDVSVYSKIEGLSYPTAVK